MKFPFLMVPGILMAASVAVAQQSDIPSFINGLEGVSYQGRVGGMDIYMVDGFKDLFLVSPDGRTTVKGTVFSANGKDIGSAYNGTIPITAFEQSEPAGSTPPKIESVAAAAANPDTMPNALGEVGIPNSAAPSAWSDRAIMERSASRAEKAIPAPDGNEYGDRESTDSKDMLPISRGKAPPLGSLSTEDNDILIEVLGGIMRNVESDTEFKSGIEFWVDEIMARHKTEGPDSDIVSDPGGSNDPGYDAQRRALTTAGPATAPDAPLTSLVEPEKFSADSLLDETRHNAFWFGVGNRDAPAIYAFIDPACVHCSHAITAMGDTIASGHAQLRVALAPVVSRQSPDIIAAIMLSDEPPIAFMEHEYAWTRGRTNLPQARWNDLPEPVRNALLRNVAIMKKHKISGVPFFVFDTGDGARTMNGVPPSEAFAAAIRDRHAGTKRW